MDPEMETSELLAALRESVRVLIEGRRRIAVAYSGGLDSSLVAHLSKEVAATVCYTAAIKGSSDDTNVRRYAEEGELQLRVVGLNQELLESLVRSASSALKTTDPVKISYTIPIISVLEACEEDLVLAGNGADELFGGYAKYARIDDPTDRMRQDFERMLAEGILLSEAARDHGKKIGFPFASDRVVSIARGMPKSSKIRSSERKAILRELASELGLPSRDRPKKAAQYSSGVYKEMKRLAKAEGVSLDAWTRSLVSRP